MRELSRTGADNLVTNRVGVTSATLRLAREYWWRELVLTSGATGEPGDPVAFHHALVSFRLLVDELTHREIAGSER